MEVVLRCRNDVRVDALTVNFTLLYFVWFNLSHISLPVSRDCCTVN